MNSKNIQNDRLRLVLRANAVFSLLSATAFLFFSSGISELTGIRPPSEVFSMGVSLAVFGLFLTVLTWRQSFRIPTVIVAGIIIADVGWVIGTVLGLMQWGGFLTTIGWFLVVDVALIVGAFALLQARYLWGRKKSLRVAQAL